MDSVSVLVCVCVQAEFRAPQPVIGDMYFMQDKDKPDAQTTILIDLVRPIFLPLGLPVRGAVTDS